MSQSSESKRPARKGEGAGPAGVAAPPLLPGLWIVPTPIGNVRDITLRALDVLGAADVLACEDTRRTRQLLDLHGIAVNGRPMVSYHDRNGAARRPQIMGWLEEGRSVAYCTDAGTPLIADPGYRLVNEAREAGHPVHVLPGASAVLTALCASGLPTDKFTFAGFLPPKSGPRKRVLEGFRTSDATIVFYESPHRLEEALKDLAEVLGPDRTCCVARELTKKFEEVVSGPLGELSTSEDVVGNPRGEYVLVIGPSAHQSEAPDDADLEAMMLTALKTQRVKDVAGLAGDGQESGEVPQSRSVDRVEADFDRSRHSFTRSR